jgi:hypothetical protein
VLAVSVSYSRRGRVGFVSGVGSEGVNVAVRPDHYEGVVEVGEATVFFEDPDDVAALIRVLNNLRRKLVPMGARKRPEVERD